MLVSDAVDDFIHGSGGEGGVLGLLLRGVRYEVVKKVTRLNPTSRIDVILRSIASVIGWSDR